MEITEIKKPFRSTKTLLAFFAVIGVFIAGAIGIYRGDDLAKDPVLYEVFKFSLTFFVGGVIAFIFRMAETKRQIRELRQRDLRDFYRRMLTAYNDAKKTRRLLRARSHLEGERVEILRKELDDRMFDLQSAQLSFEALRREAEASKKLFSSNQEVTNHLAKAERYLRNVLKVYEEADMGLRTETIEIALRDESFRKLSCFFVEERELLNVGTPQPDCASFDVEFSEQVHRVRRLIIGTSETDAAED